MFNPIRALPGGPEVAGERRGPGGNTVLLTKASADTPVPVSDDDDDRRLSEHGWTKACQPPWG